MAARSKLTPETVQTLEDAIRLGATFKLAAKAAGISFQTFNRWRHDEFPRGTAAEIKRTFCDRMEKAEGAAAVRWLGIIEQAAKGGTWQAAAWKLERRYPDAYGRDAEALQRLDAIEQALERWQAAGSPPIRLHDAR